ncbi:hypothetical protein RFI_15516, partial [Reticulomyxa filosa]
MSVLQHQCEYQYVLLLLLLLILILMSMSMSMELYFYPNCGQDDPHPGLTVLPVRSRLEEDLPENYRIRSVVTIRVVAKDAKHDSLITTRPHSFEREILHIPICVSEDIEALKQLSTQAGYGDMKGKFLQSRNGDDKRKYHVPGRRGFDVYMEPLPFTIEYLKRGQYITYQFEKPVLRLYVKIRCVFVRNKAIIGRYFGLMGALLMEEEKERDRLEEASANAGNHTQVSNQSYATGANQRQWSDTTAANEKQWVDVTDASGRQWIDNVEALENERRQYLDEVKRLNRQLLEMQEKHLRQFYQWNHTVLQNDKEFRLCLDRETQAKEVLRQQYVQSEANTKELESILSELYQKGVMNALNTLNPPSAQESVVSSQAHLQPQSASEHKQPLAINSTRDVLFSPSPLGPDALIGTKSVLPATGPLQTEFNVTSDHKSSSNISKTTIAAPSQISFETDEKSTLEILYHNDRSVEGFVAMNNKWTTCGDGTLLLLLDKPILKYRLTFEERNTRQCLINTYVQLHNITINVSKEIQWLSEDVAVYSFCLLFIYSYFLFCIYFFFAMYTISIHTYYEDWQRLANVLESIRNKAITQSNSSQADDDTEENSNNQSKEDNKTEPIEDDQTQDERDDQTEETQPNNAQHGFGDNSGLWPFSNVTFFTDDTHKTGQDDWGSGAQLFFDFGKLANDWTDTSKAKEAQTSQNANTGDVDDNDSADGNVQLPQQPDEDNCVEFTLQPIVQLNEVD